MGKYYVITKNGADPEVHKYDTKRDLSKGLNDLDPDNIVDVFYGKKLAVHTQTVLTAN